jgi:hypothetical protein
MALLNVHPDYIDLIGPSQHGEFDPALYRSFLQYVTEKYAGAFWHALPREAARFYRSSLGLA